MWQETLIVPKPPSVKFGANIKEIESLKRENRLVEHESASK